LRKERDIYLRFGDDGEGSEEDEAASAVMNEVRVCDLCESRNK
jgi:hypothetical protein